MDFNQAKPGLVLLLTGVVAIGITYWGLAYNQGELQITSPVLPVTISGMYDQPVECDQTLCTYEVKPRSYDLRLMAEGYTTSSTAITVKRGQTAKAFYEPVPVPQLVEADTESTYDELIYVTTQNDETTVWQRDIISDQQLTTLADAEVEIIYAEPANAIALLETEDGELVEVNVVSERKREVELPFEKDKFKLIGQEWMVWNEGTQFFYGTFGYELVNRLSLPVTTVDHIVARDERVAYFISQVPLAGAEVESGSALIDIFDIGEDEEVDVTKVSDDQPYLLYQIDLMTDEITFLEQLEWTGKDELVLSKDYMRSTLNPVIYLRANESLYKFEE